MLVLDTGGGNGLGGIGVTAGCNCLAFYFAAYGTGAGLYAIGYAGCFDRF